jgi:FtsP/CotA-like multicopper oxidase with cupredoxin domain
MTGHALILRRYRPPQQSDESDAWTVPDDRKVNPWDLNEPDPTDEGTMGTIPGPTLECNVGDRVVVHFRNLDLRTVADVRAASAGSHGALAFAGPTIPATGFPDTVLTSPDPLPVTERTHSLHPHGIVFDRKHDGAYPLSPPDDDQPVGNEEARWKEIGVTTFKKGDRVPPRCTFTYVWDTLGFATTAGVWLYHDHSICDVKNVMMGAIGFLVVHNPDDPDDVIQQDLPGGDVNGSPVEMICFPVAGEILPHDLEGLVAMGAPAPTPTRNEGKHAGHPEASERPLLLHRGDLRFELERDLRTISCLYLPRYRQPPKRAQYLQLFHELPGVGSCINGRQFLGNTPTVIGGLDTKMRFGLGAMDRATFHTFHLHGHRWVIPGPVGATAAQIETSTQTKAVSQFEDTKIFGPAETFSFTIDQGSAMGALFRDDPSRAPGVGEWHMHCHVLDHMHDGMMGSLLVIRGPAFAFRALPSGVPCPTPSIPPNTVRTTIGNRFVPDDIEVPTGTVILFEFDDPNHTVTTRPGSAQTIEINGGDNTASDKKEAVPVGQTRTFTVQATSGEILYECGIHPSMTGRIRIAGPGHGSH